MVAQTPARAGGVLRAGLTENSDMNNIGIHSFRQVSGGVLEREIKLDRDGGQGLRQSGSSRLAARFMGWIKGSSEAQRQQKIQDRIQVKQAFVSLLEKTEGKDAALRALGACGLPKGWERDDRPLTNRTVRQVLEKAQQFRMEVVRSNEKLLAGALKGLHGPEHRDLRAAISRAVRNDARYGSEKLNESDIQALRRQAEDDLRAVRQSQCEERFPKLSGLVKGAPDGAALRNVNLDASEIVSGLREIYRGQADRYPLLHDCLDGFDRATDLLGRQAWNRDGLAGLARDLDAHINSLRALRNQMTDECTGRALVYLERQARHLEAVANLEHARSQPDWNGQEMELLRREVITGSLVGPAKQESDLYDALAEELDHQINLLEAKRAYVQEMRLTDPLTDRSVKHTGLVWAHAGQTLLDRLEQDVHDGRLALDGRQLQALATLKAEWQALIADRGQQYQDSSNVDALQSIPAPSKDNKDTHPIVQVKRDTLDLLRRKLEEAGVPKQTVQSLFSRESLARAERQALAGMDTWQPVNREMVVMRDGVMRTYTSKIVPAQFIDPSLGVDLGGRVGGTSAGVKDSVDHARNLKVSTLADSSGKVMTTVVGHGVLDMWDVQDPAQRQAANRRGAKEVLEVALSSNDRLRRSLTDPNRDPNAPAPRLVHVSVNLISPDTVRDLLPLSSLRDYKERTYTFNQFRAFEENSGPNQRLRVFDPQHPGGNRTATVDVDAITFSFGINGIATGKAQHFLFGAWKNVHEHNTRNMVKLIGDLGEGTFGARGARPGGFIGEVYDRLEALRDDPGAAPQRKQEAERLMGLLRGQTDLVRTMFTEKVFREGKGDTAKMGREILVLQGLAEQGLDLVGATDLAGTMSKGCKSDKDRGGVTDVELKSKLILRDMGGEMNPDERLEGDDQGVYYTVSASSGQLENQRWNTGMGGSKEAGHLKQRLPDPEVRQFLCGLGKFAKA